MSSTRRIVLDGRYVADHFPGIGRYVYNLAFALGDLVLPHRLLVLHNPALVNTRYNIGALADHPAVELIATAAQPFSLAEQWQIPALLRKLGADIYHAPYYLRPYTALPCPSVTTLYDAIPRLFPTEVSARARLLFDALTRLASLTSRRVITISESARADLIGAYQLTPGHVAVTLLAADARFRPQPASVVKDLRAKYKLPQPYILTLASNKPHKNLPLLIEAFHLLQRSAALAEGTSSLPTLVLAGHWDARYPEARQQAARLGMETSVRFLSDVDDADLPALYAGAELFVYVSRYEGFGLPVLEALASGTPVLCGNHSSMPEVVGDAAFFVDVTRPAAIAEGLRQLLQDATKRASLRERGLRRSAQFSWRRTAEQTLHVYKQAGINF